MNIIKPTEKTTFNPTQFVEENFFCCKKEKCCEKFKRKGKHCKKCPKI